MVQLFFPLRHSPLLCINKTAKSMLDSLLVQQQRRAMVAPSEYRRRAHELRLKVDSYMKSTGKNSDHAMDTIVAHCGAHSIADGDVRYRLNEPLSPSLTLSTTFERPPDGYPQNGQIYSRTCNPTRKLLEREVAALETSGMTSLTRLEETFCRAFSSGMAAVSSLLLAYPEADVLLPDDCYHGVPTQLLTVLNQHGIKFTSVDMTNLNRIKSAIDDWKGSLSPTKASISTNRRTLIIWLETPSNPLTNITDIRAVCDVAQTYNLCGKDGRIVTVVDSTWSPPNITQPLLLGADAVLHSGTKYFGGHSDATLGLITTSPITLSGRELGPKLAQIQAVVGSIASPFDSWLCLRGLRTLVVRLQRQSQSAMELSTFLQKHPLVVRTHYPGLSSHPQHDVAAKQMRNGLFGGMLSFEVSGGETMATAVAAAVSLIKRATSLGGTETLIEHRASIEPVGRVTSPVALLRLSVGLEDVTDLKNDLAMALEVAKVVVATEKR